MWMNRLIIGQDKNRFSKLFIYGCLVGILCIITGCATATAVKFSAEQNIPEDKALLYVYRSKQFSGAGHKYNIYINDKPQTVLVSGSYYPVLIDPGSVKIQADLKAQIFVILEGALSKKMTVLEFEAEPGKTYYAKYLKSIPTPLSWNAVFSLVDNDQGLLEINHLNKARNFNE